MVGQTWRYVLFVIRRIGLPAASMFSHRKRFFTTAPISLGIEGIRVFTVRHYISKNLANSLYRVIDSNDLGTGEANFLPARRVLRT